MKSPLAYIGGKSKLADQIISMIPEHKTYCEAFTGAAWVFFKKEPSQYEVLNDLDSDLITFYRVVQNHLEEFAKQFKFILVSREWWKDWNDQLKARGLTDIQKAARYYFIQRLCFGGKVSGRTFGTAPGRQPKINLLRFEEELSDVHLRLARVTIENLSYQKLLMRYDRPDTFFYLDPPYYEKPVYKHNFYSIDDFREINEILGKIKGKFILSINDCDEIREVFGGFNLIPVSLQYSVGAKDITEGKELIIRNF